MNAVYPGLMEAGARNKTSPKGGTPRRTRKRRATVKSEPTAADRQVEETGTTNAASTEDRVRRNRKIYRRWATGVPISVLAEDEDLTERRVQQIVDEYRATGGGHRLATDPLAGLRHVDDTLEHMMASIGMAATIYEKAVEQQNWSAALGALRRQSEARRELMELMQNRGLLPRNLQYLAFQSDGVELAEMFIGILQKHGTPIEVMSELAEAVNVRLMQDRGVVSVDRNPPEPRALPEVTEGA